MSHDLYSSWASSEIATICDKSKSLFFNNYSSITSFLSYAGKDTSAVWPIADGVLNIEINNSISYICAVEFKRENEGIHGLLTALGQAISYLEKGYNASIIIIPERYSSHPNPAQHLSNMISLTLPNAPISIFTYSMPDTTSPRPFRNKLTCVRSIELDINSSHSSTAAITSKNIIKTQWAHLREGSFEPDGFFKYLQIAKQLDPNSLVDPSPILSPEIITAINSITNQDPIIFLSNCPNNTFSDYTWRNFWFNYILTPDLLKLFTKDSSGTYHISSANSLILKNDGQTFKKFFEGRKDSLKNKLVDLLNLGAISESEAYEKFVISIRDRAHSYREDIDSTLLHIGLICNDGKPSELAYKFIDSCERSNSAYSSSALAIYSYAILKEGDLASFLFYVYKLSEELFSDNPLLFTASQYKSPNKLMFIQKNYINSLYNTLTNDLKVIRTTSRRSGSPRMPFQAEFAVLHFIKVIGKFRIGLVLEINWPKVIEILSMEL